MSPSPRAEGDWFGHPRGLTILFLTEMWEVFSFVGMRTLLIYYMTLELMVRREQASLIYGLYTGFVYLTPIVGGYLADRWLGRRAAVLIGGGAMAVGQLMMTAPALLYPAMATIALGVGLFLPSLPSQIASLYADDDPRRGSAYTVYYVGKNIGALLAALVCGAIGELYGWRWGFAAGAVGMMSGLCVYAAGRRWLPADPKRTLADADAATTAREPDLRARLALLAAVGLAVVVFRGAYEQTGNAVALWIESDVDRRIGTWTVPMTWFQSINPALVFLLSPLLIVWWTRRGREGRDAAPAVKMALGAVLLGVAYLVLAGGAALAEAQGRPPSWALAAGFFFLLTVAELHILPIGLGLFGRLAPKLFTATVLAFWYLTSFGGNLLAGLVGSFSGRLSAPVFFSILAALALCSAVMLRLCAKPAAAVDRPRDAS